MLELLHLLRMCKHLKRKRSSCQLCSHCFPSLTANPAVNPRLYCKVEPNPVKLYSGASRIPTLGVRFHSPITLPLAEKVPPSGQRPSVLPPSPFVRSEEHTPELQS